MRTTFVSLGMLFARFLAGCHDRRPVRGLPLAPAAINDSESVEPTPPSVGSNAPSIREIVAPTSNEPDSIKYSLNELLLELADAYFDLDQHDLRAKEPKGMQDEV